MGAIGGLLGLSGGMGGTGFNATPTVTPEQLAAGYQGAQSGLQQQQELIKALQAQQGLANQSQVYGQLQDVIAGRGPNPAQAMLAQATGQNVANQAALMAGQRGAAGNVGLMARQAAQAGAGAQQQAAGQAATMQAQQAMNALGQAGGLSTQQAQQQIGATQAGMAGQLQNQAQMQQAAQQYNALQAGLAGQQMQNTGRTIGGLLGGLGQASALAGGAGAAGGAAGGATMAGLAGDASTLAPALMFAADGGMVPGEQSQGPKSSFGRFMAGAAPMAHGGSVGSKLKAGGHVPGKAQVSGDSLKNDTVHAMLSPGEVVIPRSVMQGKDPARGAAEFVQAVMAKKRLGK